MLIIIYIDKGKKWIPLQLKEKSPEFFEGAKLKENFVEEFKRVMNGTLTVVNKAQI